MAEVTAPQTQAQTAPSSPAPRKPVKKGRKKMIKRLVALGVTLAVVAGAGFGMWYLVFRDDSTLGAPQYATAEIGTIQSTVEGYGTAVPKESASITLNAAGTGQEV